MENDKRKCYGNYSLVIKLSGNVSSAIQEQFATTSCSFLFSEWAG
ncbi:hypothetical protein [Paenibacillus sp. PL91]|nr:hypothetical protein [Paenibacillus sp. PL91]